ncbi:MAG: S8 family serine peptidase [Acholeplasmataceae bacterium]|nr:S8 family serine peptidase [Acholeplasmataceae bacterium]
MDFFSIKIRLLTAKILYTIIIMASFVLVFTLGTTNEDYPIYISELDIQQMMQKSQGEGITIAFLDSGMNEHLQVLYGNRVVSPIDLVTNSEVVTDSNGHGTSMICIATCDYSQTGIFGIAPKTRVMPIVVFDSNGNTTGSLVSQGIRYAVDHDADIINMSFGSYVVDLDITEAIQYASDHNVIMIASAGDVFYERLAFPAIDEDVISVGSYEVLDDMNMDYQNVNVNFITKGEKVMSIRYISESEQFILRSESGSSVSSSIITGLFALQSSSLPLNYFEIVSKKISIKY